MSFVTLRTSWAELKQDIFDVLVSLAWPAIHFQLQFLLFSDLVPDLQDFVTLRNLTFRGTRGSRVRENFVLYARVGVLLLKGREFFIIDSLFETSVLYLIGSVSALIAEVVRDRSLSIPTHHLCSSSGKLGRTDIEIQLCESHNCCAEFPKT